MDGVLGLPLPPRLDACEKKLYERNHHAHTPGLTRGSWRGCPAFVGHLALRPLRERTGVALLAPFVVDGRVLRVGVLDEEEQRLELGDARARCCELGAEKEAPPAQLYVAALELLHLLGCTQFQMIRCAV